MTEAPSNHVTARWHSAARHAALGADPARDDQPPAYPRLLPCLDWSHHQLDHRMRPCRLCRRPALMVDAEGLPCHKSCAEDELVRTLGMAGALAAAAASCTRRQTRAGS